MKKHPPETRRSILWIGGLVAAFLLLGPNNANLLHAGSNDSNGAAEPSVLSKIGTGTKNFFSGIGNAVTPQKNPPAQQLPTNPWVKPVKKEETKSSWFSWLWVKQDEKKTKTPSKWISQKRTDTKNRESN